MQIEDDDQSSLNNKSAQKLQLENMIFDYDEFYDRSNAQLSDKCFHLYNDSVNVFYKILMFAVSSEEDAFQTIEDQEYFIKQNNTVNTNSNNSSRKTDNNNSKLQLLEKPIGKILEEVYSDIIEAGARTTKSAIDNINNIETETGVSHNQLNEHQQQVNRNVQTNTKHNQLWTSKYMPTKFTELLTADKINRNVLSWCIAWENKVFKDKIQENKIIQQKQHEFSIFQASRLSKQHMLNSNYQDQDKEKNPNDNIQQSKNNQTGAQNGDTLFKPKQFMNFDLDDKIDLQKMRNNVILLGGPPGCGKTTLARINASDERTASKIIEKIEDVTNSESLNGLTSRKLKTSLQNQNQKTSQPSLLILDEIDGVFSSNDTSQQSKSPIDEILDYIFNGKKQKQVRRKQMKKPLDQNNQNETSMEKEEIEIESEEIKIPSSAAAAQNNDDLNKIMVKRPIIFICNDAYAKGLRALRKRALVLHCKPTEQEKLYSRLRMICAKEKLYLDIELLYQVIELNNCDVRGCLNMLEQISKQSGGDNNNNPNVNAAAFFLLQKESSKSFTAQMEALFISNADLNAQNGGAGRQMAKGKNEKLHLIDINEIMVNKVRNIEYNNLSEGLFCNYLKVKLPNDQSEAFMLISSFLAILTQSDVLQRKILRFQFYGLSKYTTLPAVLISLHFQGGLNEGIEFPTQPIEIRKQFKQSEETVQQLLKGVQTRDAIYLRPRIFIAEIISFLYQIIHPTIESTILKESEKANLYTSLYLMQEYSLEIIKNTFPYRQNVQYIFEFQPLKNKFQLNPVFQIKYKPYIEKLLIFGKCLPETSNDIKLQTLQRNNYVYVKSVRAQEILRNEANNEQYDNRLPDQQAQLDGKMLPNYDLSIYGAGKERQAKYKGLSKNNDGFVFKFVSGMNNAVKYDVKMNFFFNHTHTA